MRYQMSLLILASALISGCAGKRSESQTVGRLAAISSDDALTIPTGTMARLKTNQFFSANSADKKVYESADRSSEGYEVEIEWPNHECWLAVDPTPAERSIDTNVNFTVQSVERLGSWKYYNYPHSTMPRWIKMALKSKGGFELAAYCTSLPKRPISIGVFENMFSFTFPAPVVVE